MRSAAVELATSGVTVNAVMPGNIETPGLGETGDEHQRADALVDPDGRASARPRTSAGPCASSPRPRPAYVTGQTLIVDGGQVLPEAPPPPLTNGALTRPLKVRHAAVHSRVGLTDGKRGTMARKHVLAVVGAALALGATVFATGCCIPADAADRGRPEQREPDLLVLGRARRARRERLAQEAGRRLREGASEGQDQRRHPVDRHADLGLHDGRADQERPRHRHAVGDAARR